MNCDITIEALPLLGICNLCLKSGAVESMIAAKINNMKYSDVLLNCFGIDISKFKLGDVKQVICAECIEKLRNCQQFRELAEKSLKTLADRAKEIKNEDFEDHTYGINRALKSELRFTSDDDDDDDFNCEDDEGLADLIKGVKSDGFSDHRTKRKSPNSVRGNEYVNLLSRGLFFFKTLKNYYSCIVCSYKNTSLDPLLDHMKEHSTKYIQMGYKKNACRCNFYLSKNKFFCKICSKEISNFEQLKQHSKCGPSPKWDKLPFKLEKNQSDCPICKKNFLNYCSLNIHMNTHFPHYVCDNCGKGFASMVRLNTHVRTHKIGNFPCKICGQIFDKMPKRANHVLKEHKAGVKYSCTKCTESFPSFYARQKHLADIHNEDLRKYKCKACTRSFVTSGHLSSHVRRDHLIERNYKCQKCELAFYTRDSLNTHMIKHDGQRIHTCHFCQKSYQRKKTLTEHLRIHNNDKRFACPLCGRAFTQKCTLKGHLKLHEVKTEGDKPQTKSD